MSANDPVPSRLQFEVTPYVPDGGGGSLAAALQLISILCSVGILLGIAVSFIGQFFYLVLFFPILMGLAVGWFGAKTIARYKVRKERTCAVAGFAAGCLCFLTVHYTDYLRFEGQMEQVPEDIRQIARNIDALSAAGDKVPQEIRDVITKFRADPEALKHCRVNGFLSFMDLEARNGVTLTSTHGGGKGNNLGYYGSIIYWIVEGILLAAVAAAIMRTQASKPFCADCVCWKHEAVLLETPVLSDQILPSVKQGDLASLEHVLQNPGIAKVKRGVFTRISTCVCPECDAIASFEVKVDRVTINNKQKNATRAAQITYPVEALEPLKSIASRLTFPIA